MNGLGRYKRVIKYIGSLEDKNKKAKNSPEMKKLLKKLKFAGYKLRSLETIRIIAIILLYSSVTSTIISIIPGFELLSKNIVQLSSVIGSTIFLIMVGITTKLISLYMIDMQLVSSHIISIYTKKK